MAANCTWDEVYAGKNAVYAGENATVVDTMLVTNLLTFLNRSSVWSQQSKVS